MTPHPRSLQTEGPWNSSNQSSANISVRARQSVFGSGGGMSSTGTTHFRLYGEKAAVDTMEKRSMAVSQANFIYTNRVGDWPWP